MGFKKDYNPDQPYEGEEEFPGFMSKEEKAAIIDKGTVFTITGARDAETSVGDRIMLDLIVKLPGQRTAVDRVLSFNPTAHRQRSRMLRQMIEYFDENGDGAEPIEARLVKDKRAHILELV